MIITRNSFMWIWFSMPLNTPNPAWCVATVCHQVSCMFWGHLGLFHRTTSHLNWNKMVCMWDSAYTCSRMRSTNMFSHVFAIRDSSEFPLIICCVFYRRTSLFSCLSMFISMMTPNSSGSMQKHGYLRHFYAVSTREIHPGFILFHARSAKLCWKMS